MRVSYHGFTLIELLFTMMILAILIVLSMPTLASFFNKNVQQNDAIRLFHTLQFARTEAIKQQCNITLCPSQDLKHCSNDWSNGFIVYRVNPENTILRAQKNTQTSHIQTPSLERIEYTKEGRCLSRGTIYFYQQEKILHKIVLYDSGRARIE